MIGLPAVSLKDLIDIVAVASIIYLLMRLIRGTRGWYMLTGLLICLVIFWVARVVELRTLNWMLEQFIASLVLIVVIIFQHDIRRLLTKVGRSTFFTPQSMHRQQTIEELVKTCVSLANKKIGAIICIEREGSVSDYVEQGVKLDALVSKDLLTAIFIPVSPLHDGAVVVQRSRVTMAGCLLPLSMNPEFTKVLGTRHLAALGLAEEVDAVVLIVSEESGLIALAVDGEIIRNLDGMRLRERLHEIYQPPKAYSFLGNIWEKWARLRKNATKENSAG